jgi:hypothetical protein
LNPGDSDRSSGNAHFRFAKHVIQCAPDARLGRASDSTRSFGLIFREAGPVVPSTFEVVATKVASSVTEGFKRMAFVMGCGLFFFGFTMGGGSGKCTAASID